MLSVLGKVFAWIILDSFRHHLLEHQCPKQLGYTPKRSTIERILALRVLTECRQMFNQGMFTAYVYLRKVLNSVNWHNLWRILVLLGSPPKWIHLISELYSGTESLVRCCGSTSDLFPVVTGVRQGWVLAPNTFQCLLGLDSVEDVREIKLQCIVWECQDL